MRSGAHIQDVETPMFLNHIGRTSTVRYKSNPSHKYINKTHQHKHNLKKSTNVNCVLFPKTSQQSARSCNQMHSDFGNIVYFIRTVPFIVFFIHHESAFAYTYSGGVHISYFSFSFCSYSSVPGPA